MNPRIALVLAGLVALADSAQAELGADRRDYILAHPHGWVEIAVDDRAIPDVPSRDEEHPGLVRPEACRLKLELNGESFVRDSTYPTGDKAPYTARSGFRFPAPVGRSKLKLGYSGCDVEGEKLATVEVEASIVVEENRVTELAFDGTRLTRAKPKPDAK